METSLLRNPTLLAKVMMDYGFQQWQIGVFVEKQRFPNIIVSEVRNVLPMPTTYSLQMVKVIVFHRQIADA
ncbi:MAG: hypothetical protein M1834_005814 [Cirrosporium novae-zelandiae]|nr:MAG: hypothetical protein M1834_005814 [Cirrosporium novae-zelandiae]